jgi:predicted dehydrogenase
MKLGLVGPGRHGRRYLEERNGGAHVVAVCGRADDLGLMLPSVQGVIVATPPDTHRDIVLRCLEAGKDVLCEKPLALTWDDCRAMLDAAESLGRRLVVAHQHLWADGFRPMLGNARRFASVSGGPAGHDYSAWLDWGSHDVAMAIAALGEPPESVSVERLGEAYRARLSFPGGDMADIMTGLLPTKLRVVEAETSSGVLYYDGRHAPGREPMRLMVEAFVRGETEWRSSVGFGRAVYKAMFGEVNHG